MIFNDHDEDANMLRFAVILVLSMGVILGVVACFKINSIHDIDKAAISAGLVQKQNTDGTTGYHWDKP